MLFWIPLSDYPHIPNLFILNVLSHGINYFGKVGPLFVENSSQMIKKTKVERVKLEKAFDFEIRLLGIG